MDAQHNGKDECAAPDVDSYTKRVDQDGGAYHDEYSRVDDPDPVDRIDKVASSRCMGVLKDRNLKELFFVLGTDDMRRCASWPFVVLWLARRFGGD